MVFCTTSGQIKRALFASPPPDVLGAVSTFLLLEQRLSAGLVSRRWQEILWNPELWEDLDVYGNMLEKLPRILLRCGASVQRLTIRCGSRPLWRPDGVVASSLVSCRRLERLELQYIRGTRELWNSWEFASVMPSLRRLRLEHAPYFLLSRYNHRTGASLATVPLQWLSRSFPALLELFADYLRIGDGDSLTALHDLSLVAVVCSDDDERPASWNTEGCNQDLTAISGAFPGLRRLELRGPSAQMGRMSRMPGQSLDDMIWMVRRFTATSLELLRGVRHRFASLSVLEVETLQDEPCLPLDQHLSTFLGIDDAATVSAPLHFRFGGSAKLLSRCAVLGTDDNRLTVEFVGAAGDAHKHETHPGTI